MIPVSSWSARGVAIRPRFESLPRQLDFFHAGVHASLEYPGAHDVWNQRSIQSVSIRLNATLAGALEREIERSS